MAGVSSMNEHDIWIETAITTKIPMFCPDLQPACMWLVEDGAEGAGYLVLDTAKQKKIFLRTFLLIIEGCSGDRRIRGIQHLVAILRMPLFKEVASFPEAGEMLSEALLASGGDPEIYAVWPRCLKQHTAVPHMLILAVLTRRYQLPKEVAALVVIRIEALHMRRVAAATPDYRTRRVRFNAGHVKIRPI
jgi:hypothetical protein